MAKTTAQHILDYWYFYEIFSFESYSGPRDPQDAKLYTDLAGFSDQLPWHQQDRFPLQTFSTHDFEIYFGLADDAQIAEQVEQSIADGPVSPPSPGRPREGFVAKLVLSTELGYLRIVRAEISSMFWAVTHTTRKSWPEFHRFDEYLDWLNGEATNKVAPYLTRLRGEELGNDLLQRIFLLLLARSESTPDDIEPIWHPGLARELVADEVLTGRPAHHVVKAIKKSSSSHFERQFARLFRADPSLVPTFIEGVKEVLRFRATIRHPAKEQAQQKLKQMIEAFDANVMNALRRLHKGRGYKPPGFSLQQELDRVFAMPPFEILNSFYLEDMALVMGTPPREWPATIAALFHSSAPADTATYTGERLDLFAEEAKGTIFAGTAPSLTPLGRWPVASERMMSTMQQYAINRCTDLNEEAPLLSVNGPPGTGKTTLLKDVLAAKISQRADVLASLSRPDAGFKSGVQHRLANGYIVYELIDELKGFEVLIACNTNKAAENLSLSLPKASEIAEDYHGEFTWLQGLTRRYELAEPSGAPEEDLWGLIAVALGKSSNVNALHRRLAGADRRLDEDKEGVHCNLVDWLDRPGAISFPEAKKAYLRQRQKLTGMMMEADAIWRRWLRATPEDEQRRLQAQLADEQADEQALAEAVADIEEQIAAHKELAHTPKPHSLAVLLSSSKKALVHRIDAAKADLADGLVKRGRLKDDHRASKKRVRQLKERLAGGETKEQVLAACPAELREQLLATDQPLDSAEVQMKVPLQTAQLNRQRNLLFKAALVLSEAWLDAVKKKRLFSLAYCFGLIFRSSTNSSHNEARVELLKQLFMLFPAASFTLASFRRAFSHVPPGSFGLALIDEAGQALPQAALGVMLRCKKVIAVGDPLQIEPIVTMPPRLLSALAEHFGRPRSVGEPPRIHAADRWRPEFQSAQTLFDRSHPYTAKIDEGQYVGMPLRVHRRCAEPMFSLANDMAYDGKMLNGGKGEVAPHPILGPSRWLDVIGPASGEKRHFVAEQAACIIAQLEALVAPWQSLDDKQRELAGVYVITPFKEAAWLFKRAIRERRLALPEGWLSNHVGTIHTFQGQEAPIVFLLLGLDRSGKGSGNAIINSKPNIPNVAVTRAKSYCYIVGDYSIWGEIVPFAHFSSWPHTHGLQERPRPSQPPAPAVLR